MAPVFVVGCCSDLREMHCLLKIVNVLMFCYQFSLAGQLFKRNQRHASQVVRIEFEGDLNSSLGIRCLEGS